MNPIPIRWRRVSVVVAHDVIMAAVAFAAAFYLRVNNELFGAFQNGFFLGTPLFILVCALSFYTFGMYRGVWRYASLPDLLAITKAVTTAVLIFIAITFFINRGDDIPRSVPIIAWFVLMACIGGPRFAYRLMKDGSFSGLWDTTGKGRIPVLLIGARDGAELFIRAMINDREAPYRVVGIIDDRNRRVGRDILGIPVMGSLTDFSAVVNDLSRRGNRPQRLIMTQVNGPIAPDVIRDVLDQATDMGLPISRLPSLTDFRHANPDGRLEPRPIDIADLLGRPQKALDRDAMGQLVQGKRVIVTGAGGSIGGELAKQLSGLGAAELVLVDQAEYLLYETNLSINEGFPRLKTRSFICDVRDGARVRALFDEIKPELVFHAAALKHVPVVEAQPCEGVMTNVMGTRHVADAAKAVGAEAMVLISTDKAVHPSSVMGATKRLAETYCQALDRQGQASGDKATRFVTVRFGNVLGSTGSVVPLFTRQLRKGGPLTVTDERATRYFMTLREAVELVLHASAYAIQSGSEQGKILVLDMGDPVKIDDLARQMIRLAGLQPDHDIKIEYTGLRPGEKLTEELLYESEPVDRTSADGVLVADPQVADLALISRQLTKLGKAADALDEETTLKQLRHVVPTYKTPDIKDLKRATASQPDTNGEPEAIPALLQKRDP
ncbi:MAG: nucleoside-diphosphate sugar epimerase/dehydratase [Pseudomonadota bacterium]